MGANNGKLYGSEGEWSPAWFTCWLSCAFCGVQEEEDDDEGEEKVEEEEEKALCRDSSVIKSNAHCWELTVEEAAERRRSFACGCFVFYVASLKDNGICLQMFFFFPPVRSLSLSLNVKRNFFFPFHPLCLELLIASAGSMPWLWAGGKRTI